MKRNNLFLIQLFNAHIDLLLQFSSDMGIINMETLHIFFLYAIAVTKTQENIFPQHSKISYIHNHNISHHSVAHNLSKHPLLLSLYLI